MIVFISYPIFDEKKRYRGFVGSAIYLKEKNVLHEVTEHKAVYNMEEVSQIDIPYPEAEAKNLFVRDDKKINYYLKR